MLLASFWMPHIRGCDGKVLTPSKDAGEMLVAGEVFEAALAYWPYLCVFVTSSVLIICVLARWRHTDIVLLVTQGLLLGSVLVGCWFRLIGQRQRGEFLTGPPLKELFLELPPLVITAVWCGQAIRRRDWITAWARLATLSAVFSIYWLFVSYLFGKESFYGLYVAYIALAGLVVSPWWFRASWERMLISSEARRRPLQFRLGQLLFVVGLIAVLYGYYRYLPPLLGID